jgi:hypothetical protein
MAVVRRARDRVTLTGPSIDARIGQFGGSFLD